MSKIQCPGQDTSFWKPGDIFEVPCGICGYVIEFFKDDATRRCRECGEKVSNPKLNLGCAQWCEHAKECLGFDPKERMLEAGGEDSLAEQILLNLGRTHGDVKSAQARLDIAGRLIKAEGARPGVVMVAAALAGVDAELRDDILAEVITNDAMRDDIAELIASANDGAPASLEQAVLKDTLAFSGGKAGPDGMHTASGRLMAAK